MAKRTRDIAACAQRLREGGLVAFPTETVYGLGAHSLDPQALQQVFAAKERPHSDPLISHVLSVQEALEGLWKTHDDSAVRVLTKLCDKFWPGPLTLVYQAQDHVPDLLSAGTRQCAVRSPAHPTARSLLEQAQRPIAAPSANKFGHVSPTTSDHVWDDLKGEDVWILEHDEGPLRVGVESTVAKLHTIDDALQLTVLRQGAISSQQLQDAIPNLSVVSATHTATPDNHINVSPGQTIRHYAPHVPSFLVSSTCLEQSYDKNILKSAVVVDFGKRLAAYQSHCLAYRDMSVSQDAAEAARSVFETLRWTESIDGAECVLLPQLEINMNDEALYLAVRDRLMRASSGVVVDSLQDVRSSTPR